MANTRRTCEYCDDPFPPRKQTDLYCSEACRILGTEDNQRIWRTVDEILGLELERVHKGRVVPPVVEKDTGEKVKHCIRCGGEFPVEYNGRGLETTRMLCLVCREVHVDNRVPSVAAPEGAPRCKSCDALEGEVYGSVKQLNTEGWCEFCVAWREKMKARGYAA